MHRSIEQSECQHVHFSDHLDHEVFEHGELSSRYGSKRDRHVVSKSRLMRSKPRRGFQQTEKKDR